MVGFESYRIALSPREILLDEKLHALKQSFKDSYKGNYITLKDSEIWESGLYRFCLAMPKGADLHIHGLACLPVEEMVSWLMGQGDIVINTGPMPERGSIRTVALGAEIPPPYKLFSDAILDGDITPEELGRIWTVLGAGKDQTVWEWFETIFDRHLFATTDSIVERYYEAVFRYCLKVGIMHIEIRILPFGTPSEAASMATAIRNAYYKVMDLDGDFCVKLLGAALKYSWIDLGVTRTMLENAVYIHENVQDTRRGEPFLTGVDLVNEEDRSHPISFYGDLLTEIVKDRPGLSLMLHCGETLRQDSTSIREALALHPVRIGHGFNLYDHPGLKKQIKDEDICMEVCPVSNLMLGYVSDLASHPARGYYRDGLPMILSSDDPAFQEHHNLVDDFFVATACWDLSLKDLKQLAFNSIKYCSASPATKEKLFVAWRGRWDDFVEAFLA